MNVDKYIKQIRTLLRNYDHKKITDEEFIVGVESAYCFLSDSEAYIDSAIAVYNEVYNGFKKKKAEKK